MHATCVALGERGVLITGPSGSGKSDLAFRLIDQPGFGIRSEKTTAQLVADDQVVLTQETGWLIASPPEQLAGLLEIRGLGIVSVPHTHRVCVSLLVKLVSEAGVERIPEAAGMTDIIEGISLPAISVDASSPSAPAKIRAALQVLSACPIHQD